MARAISVDFWKKILRISKCMFSSRPHIYSRVIFMKALLYLTVLFLMLRFPDLYIPSAHDALRLWGVDVVPSLFPYMVFCRLLAEQLRYTRISPVSIAAFLGLLGGSPSGASILAAYCNAIPKKLLLPLSILTGTISPTFILHTTNRWTHDPVLCRVLLICCLLGSAAASFIAYGLISIFPANFLDPPLQSTPENTQISPIIQSISAILNIGGCIVVYRVVSVLICSSSFFTSHPVLSSLVYAFLEMSGGIHAISTLPNTSMRSYMLCAAASFSGFSILAQNAYFLNPLGIRMRHQVLFSLLRMAGSVFTMHLYIMLF